MESPFRSEEAAFRFLLITIGAFALIVIASAISTALGFITFLALSAAAVAVYLRQRGPAPEPTHVEPLAGSDERRVLVVVCRMPDDGGIFCTKDPERYQSCYCFIQGTERKIPPYTTR